MAEDEEEPNLEDLEPEEEEEEREINGYAKCPVCEKDGIPLYDLETESGSPWMDRGPCIHCGHKDV